MALQTGKKSNDKKQKVVVVQKRTFLDKRGKATTRVRDAVSLFAIPGQEVTLEEARKVGLSGEPSTSTSSDSVGITDTKIDLSRANKATLEAEAEKRNLDKTGTNKDIRERIEAYDAAQDESGQNETSE